MVYGARVSAVATCDVRAVPTPDGTVFVLQNTRISHVFAVHPSGLLEHVHHGPPVRDVTRLPRFLRTPRECAVEVASGADINLNIMPREYPTPGQGDFRGAALAGASSAGGRLFDLRYVSHQVRPGKPGLDPLPGSRGDGATTLSVTLQDALSGLRAVLHYTIWSDHPVMARSVRLENAGDDTLVLDRALSACLDLPPGDYDAVHLHGSWSRELAVERVAVPHATLEVGSTRGTSSAAHAPFLAVLARDASEAAGRVHASTLVYSGNHAFSVETGEFGGARVMCGINPQGFQWTLEPGGSFETPESLWLYSEAGLRGMSEGWHDFARAHILPERFRDTPRPTYLNTWEAAYFDVAEARVLELADKAAGLGVEMLVLDDGWFGRRRDDTSSLGDWHADPKRFPRSIPALARDVAARGLRFGLWIEPEMVNPDSELYRAHPDWVLHQPGREPSLGRNQFTLDLGRAEVREHLFGRIEALLGSGDVHYVKWDMNRAMSEVGSGALPPARQGEAAHRHTLGLYQLLARLTGRFPDVMFEACASGGNRLDFGMLRFMPQAWVSDMVDPVGRRDIVEGASLFLPPDALAAYLGPSPNHQNGRIASLRARYLAGVMCAAHGISLGAADIDAHSETLERFVAFSRATAAQRLGARFTRLKDAPNASAWQMTSADGRHVWVLDLHVLSAPNQPERRARLHGLDPQADYRLQDDPYGLGDDGPAVGQTLWGGDALMAAGLPLPYVTTNQCRPDVRYAPRGDFAAHLFVFQRVDRP